MKRALGESIQRLRGGRAAGSHAGAGIPQENSAGGRGGTEIGRCGLERDVAACSVDRRRSGRAIGLDSRGRDRNELRGRRAPGRNSRASVPDKRVHAAARTARHQVRRRRKERHVAPIRADRRRNTVAIGGAATQSDGDERAGRRAAGGSAQASIVHKNILRRSRRFGDAVGRS